MTRENEMKKIISSTLIILFIASFFAFFNIFGFKAKASSETDIYSETNTYNVDTTTLEKNVQKPGYEKGQYIIEYNMDNKKADCLVAENPTVTVFTHGYKSSSSDWMNNAENSDFVMQYNENSMIDKVVRLYGVDNIVLLQAKITSDKYDSFRLTQFKLTQTNVNITEIERDSSFTISSQDYGKHFIIVFEAYQTDEISSNDSNNNLYFQFNYMLSSVLYDLKQLDPSHRIPKVNLIGYSRGGLTNMQYALDHPDIVANLISIGTPYSD